ncbi:hypothetical protein [Pseudomonas fluorescens]|uniref:hypothetical protein n=1 Tax=Pseudomonas fluorescens TaxID=294 RepID=UPI0012402675|nr:hypothetical protein [Pseudomonas fluorescens]VVN23554.1 hypothetical protein PS639_04417 [Pseudomonas fluorescens]
MEYEPKFFHIEEFKQVKSEVTALLARIEALVRYSILVSAGVYSWLITSAFDYDATGICYKIPKDLIIYGGYIPIILTALFTLMIAVTYSHIIVMGKYLKKIEICLGFASLGWEEHWKSKPKIVVPALILLLVLLLVVDNCAAVSIKENVNKSHVCHPSASQKL